MISSKEQKNCFANMVTGDLSSFPSWFQHHLSVNIVGVMVKEGTKPSHDEAWTDILPSNKSSMPMFICHHKGFGQWRVSFQGHPFRRLTDHAQFSLEKQGSVELGSLGLQQKTDRKQDSAFWHLSC